MSLQPEQLDEKESLQGLAAQIAEACPDMRQTARTAAQQLLAKHGLSTLDPDAVYLHRFKTAVSSNKTFNGWQHLEHPFESLTLPQLVMHRFNANDQDNADLLSYLVGFYSDGPDCEVFDERNEVRLDARAVLEDFWQIDFASDFKARLDSFWSKHAEDFRTLAKANFLSKVLQVCAEQPGSVLATCCAKVSQALAGEHAWPPTLAQLHAQTAPGAGIRLCAFDIGGHVASDILRAELDDGQQLLYIPGEIDALQCFANRAELFWWVLEHNNHADNRARFVAHFSLDDRGEKDSAVGLNHLIDLLYQGWGHHDYSALNQLDQHIDEDAFSWLRDKARQRMLDDAHHALHSNADLRKQMWIGYLQAFAKVFGPMAAVDWPVALAVVGAGIAETGLNIDQAINGHTTQERQAGITGAIAAGINTLFNATFLLRAPGEALAKPAAAAGEAEAAAEGAVVEEPASPMGPVEEDAPATEAQVQSWVPRPFWPGEPADLLAPFETNVLLTGDPGTGDLEGIYIQDGQFYVLIEEMPYQVRRVGELKSWVIVDPENPYSFYKSQAIRLEADGQWYPVERMGLKGGMLSRLKAWGRRPPRAKLAELPANPYEISAPARPSLRYVSDLELTGEHLDLNDPAKPAAIEQYRAARDRLAQDAAAFMASPELPPRPQIPEVSAADSAQEVLQKVYQNSDGLVIGENHSALGSKRLLVDNMPRLRKLGVRTLYMEHFQTDFHQTDLAEFNRTGKMSETLDRFVSNQDRGHMTDPAGRYNFRRVLVEAQRQGIRIQPIDCMAGYREAWIGKAPSETARQQMMNFYAHQVIQADLALRGPGKWVALVGDSHANNFQGVSGLAETEGAIGLRVEDASGIRQDRFDVDTGSEKLDKQGKPFKLRSDLRMRATLAPAQGPAFMRPPRDLELLLSRPGDYTIDNFTGDGYVVSRGRDMSLRRTRILREGNFYYVQRPEWPTVHERRFTQLADLHTFLKMRGMRYIGG